MRQKIKINIFLETMEIRNSLVKCQNKSNTQASRCNQLAFDIKIMRYEYYGRICDSWFLWVSYRNSSRTLILDTLLSISSTKLLFNFISWSFWLIGGLYIFLDSNQTLFKSVKGGGVKHFLLDFGSVWAPAHQKQFFFLGLFGGTFTLMWVFEIK